MFIQVILDFAQKVGYNAIKRWLKGFISQIKHAKKRKMKEKV